MVPSSQVGRIIGKGGQNVISAKLGQGKPLKSHMVTSWECRVDVSTFLRFRLCLTSVCCVIMMKQFAISDRLPSSFPLIWQISGIRKIAIILFIHQW